MMNKKVLILGLGLLVGCKAEGMGTETINTTQSFLSTAEKNPAYAEGRSFDLNFYVDTIEVLDGPDGTRQALIKYGSTKSGLGVVESPVDIRCLTSIDEARNLVPGEKVVVHGTIGTVRYSQEHFKASYYNVMHLIMSECRHSK